MKLTGENEHEVAIIQKEISLVVDKKVERFRGKRQQLYQRYILISVCANCIDLCGAQFKKGRLKQGKLLQAIKTIPSTVQEGYERIISFSTNPKKAKTLLYLVLASQHPFHTKGNEYGTGREMCLTDASELEPESAFRETVRGLCEFFIRVHDSEIYLIHYF